MSVTPDLTAFCPEKVYRGSYSHRCNRRLRTVEQIGARLCGIHLAGKRRREANDVAREAQRAEEKAAAARADSAAVCLAHAADLLGEREVYADSRNRVSLSVDAAEKLIAQLGGESA